MAQEALGLMWFLKIHCFHGILLVNMAAFFAWSSLLYLLLHPDILSHSKMTSCLTLYHVLTWCGEGGPEDWVCCSERAHTWRETVWSCCSQHCGSTYSRCHNGTFRWFSFPALRSSMEDLRHQGQTQVISIVFYAWIPGPRNHELKTIVLSLRSCKLQK